MRSRRISASTALSARSARCGTAATPVVRSVRCTPRRRRKLCARSREDEGFDLAECTAYSDSHTDLPFLEAVGHPVAVNPDRALRKIADERSWPMLEFKMRHAA